MFGLEMRRERETEDAGKDKLDEHMNGGDKERIGERESVGGEHPFIVNREERGKEEPALDMSI